MSGTVTRTHTKKTGSDWKRKALCLCVVLFCTFLCHHCIPMTWKCPTSHFMEWQWNFLSLSLNMDMVTRNSPPRDFACLIHWQSKWGWNNCNEDWKNVNPLFQAHFIPRVGYFRNFGVGMCRWDSGTLSLYHSYCSWILLSHTGLNPPNPPYPRRGFLTVKLLETIPLTEAYTTLGHLSTQPHSQDFLP